MPVYPFLSEILEKFDMDNSDQRFLVGIAGAPASGKSTLAEIIAKTINNQFDHEIATKLNMDGYHYYNVDLLDKGIFDHKGAHFTFNAEKFILKLIETKEVNRDVKCPIYDRKGTDNPIENAHAITSNHRIVIVEGNYLLLSIYPWVTIRQVLDYAIFLEVDPDIQFKRLLKRHTSGGRNETEAKQKIEFTDLPNGELIIEDRHRADYIFKPNTNFN